MKKILLLYLLSFAIVIIAHGSEPNCVYQEKSWGKSYCDYIEKIKELGSIEAIGKCGVKQFNSEYISRLTRFEELFMMKFKDYNSQRKPENKAKEPQLENIFDVTEILSKDYLKKALLMYHPDKGESLPDEIRELNEHKDYFNAMKKKLGVNDLELNEIREPDPEDWINPDRYEKYQDLKNLTMATKNIFDICYNRERNRLDKEDLSTMREISGRSFKQKAFTMVREKVTDKAFEVFDRAAGMALETVFGPAYVENAIRGVTESLKTPTKVMKGKDELFTDKKRPYVLILNNYYRENVTLEYMGFQSKSGGQYSFTNENAHEDELEDYKIQYKQKAHVQYSEKHWYHILSGVSGNAQLLYYDDDKTFKKFLNIYVENPKLGGRKCCVEILDYSAGYKKYDGGGAKCAAEQRFRKPRKLEGSGDPSALISMIPATTEVEGKEIFTCMMTLASTKASKRKYYNAKRLEEEKQQEKNEQQEKEKQAVVIAGGVDFGKKDRTSAVPSKPNKPSKKKLSHALKDETPARTTAAKDAPSSAEGATSTTSKREAQQEARSSILALEYKMKKEPLITSETKTPDILALPSTAVIAATECKENTQIVVATPGNSTEKKLDREKERKILSLWRQEIHPEGQEGPFEHGFNNSWKVRKGEYDHTCPMDEQEKYWRMTSEEQAAWKKEVMNFEEWREWPKSKIRN